MSRSENRPEIRITGWLLQGKIRVRIDCIDAYQATWRGRRTPAIRIYGPLDHEGGTQCVVHVHGVYPYLFVPLPAGKEPREFSNILFEELETKLSEIFHRRPGAQPMFVNSVRACRAFPFYGYSSGFECFLKIELLNPTYVYKCSDLLAQGALCGTVMQPHEAHIPYLLAFLADYNLYGCHWVELGTEFEERFSSSTNRTAYEGMEIDIDAATIMNRQHATQDKRHERLFEPVDNTTAISSLAEIHAADSKRRNDLGLDPWPDLKLNPSDQSVAKAMSWGWERSKEYKSKLGDILETGKSEEFVPKNWEFLPTAAELVASKYALTDSCASEAVPIHTELVGSSSSQEDGLTQPLHTSQDFGVLPSSSVFDELQSASQDANSVSKAAHDASIVLESQFISQSSDFAEHIANAFCVSGARILRASGPCSADVSNTTGTTTTLQPHYSNPDDASVLPFSFAGAEHLLKSLKPKDLPPFEIAGRESFSRLAAYVSTEQNGAYELTRPTGSNRRLELSAPAPLTSEVEAWQAEKIKLSSSANTNSAFQFASLEELESVTEEMLLLAIEVFCETRPGKAPNASHDPICAVFWQLSGDHRSRTDRVKTSQAGVISTTRLAGCCSSSSLTVEHAANEAELLQSLIMLARQSNPDILTGYEISNSSWGYAKMRYQNLQSDGSDTFYEQLSRVKLPQTPRWKSMTSGTGAPIEESENVRGRHLLSLWSILRREVTLSKYTLEHIVYHTLHERTPHFDFDDLWRWWSGGDSAAMEAVVRYWSKRVGLVLRLFSHFEIVSRNCEKSRIIGLDFMSSLTRGSQFQVEAVMCRISRRENYLLLSPTKKQVGQQNALEYIPLVMEPMSAFYTDPVCVLDFRSLYPSIVIAYNLCYSTCIGRLDLWRGRNKLGVKQHHELMPGILNAVGAENIYVAPNGIGYVSPKVRGSLLARMLGEILESRFMINDSKRSNKSNRRYQRNLNSQQLALKFIANVTYGYTSASFSGRMPCAELADSIVLTGRELLQWCISQIESCEKWGVQPQVVYGDTDSLFVRVPKVSLEQAFRIGREIADMVTAGTPDPILLKLEKVYSPCVLLTKKRYVGNAYEAPDGGQPKFDAKGTETVRRDGTPIIQKIEKRALQILFESADLSRVKSYLQNQWRRILSGRVSIQDFCFAQEVKLGHYKVSRGTSNLPGGAVVSLKRLAKDEGMEPLYRERVPFVITAGAPGSRINDRAVSPEDMIRDPGLRIDAEYYIQKSIIPPLERIFNMIGANIRDWYQTMPRSIRTATARESKRTGSSTLFGFFDSDMCACCHDNRRQSPHDALCGACRNAEPRSRYILTSRLTLQQRVLAATATACRACSKLPATLAVPPGSATPGSYAHPCDSLDCPVFYEREQARAETGVLSDLVNSI